ncbi:MAG TPA: hypothetical protein VGQ59_19915 [Cyclobacteriaceae bacterium]|jgi:hypothetical protein|nr:hypothetical protein [Cyclobacteriaceae bacterium]
MKFLFLILTLAINIDSISQFRSQDVGHYTFAQPVSTLASTKTLVPGLLSDPTRNYKLQSPLMFASASYDYRMQNNFSWTGNVTTMSYNKGKFGTYFYWDVQGNLSGTKGFIDIAGKNKRGLKLTFLWRSIVNR